MSNEAKTKPNPGSDEARAQNCSCPVIDNGRGKGARGTRGENAVFWISGACPLHGVGANSEEN